MRQLINRLKSDEALMFAYQRGDTGAFECLYQRHKDGLSTFLYRSYPRPAIVEELAQDAWFAVIDKARDFRAEALFKTWLYQIARYRLVDFLRRKDNNHYALEAAHEPVDDNGPDDQTELTRQLMAAIADLPGEQRDALLLQEQGFSLRDIALITGDIEETVKSRLRYARKQLRQQLGDKA